MRWAAELKDKYKGEDIYVVGAGPSLNSLDMGFFNEKTTLVANKMYKFIDDPTYVVITHSTLIREALKSGNQLLVSEYDVSNKGQTKNGPDTEDIIFFKTTDHPDKFDTSVIGTDVFIFGYSVIISMIQIAAYMGAANIILCGIDLCYIDGLERIKGYNTKQNVENSINGGGLKFITEYKNDFYKRVESEISQLRDLFTDINIVSLNPFLNVKNEGHDIKTIMTEAEIKEGMEKSTKDGV